MKTIKTYEDFVNEEINLKKALTTGALAAGMAFSNPATSQTTQNIQKPDTTLSQRVNNPLVIKKVTLGELKSDSIKGYYLDDNNIWKDVDEKSYNSDFESIGSIKSESLEGYDKILLTNKYYHYGTDYSYFLMDKKDFDVVTDLPANKIYRFDMTKVYSSYNSNQYEFDKKIKNEIDKKNTLTGYFKLYIKIGYSEGNKIVRFIIASGSSFDFEKAYYEAPYSEFIKLFNKVDSNKTDVVSDVVSDVQSNPIIGVSNISKDQVSDIKNYETMASIKLPKEFDPNDASVYASFLWNSNIPTAPFGGMMFIHTPKISFFIDIKSNWEFNNSPELVTNWTEQSTWTEEGYSWMTTYGSYTKWSELKSKSIGSTEHKKIFDIGLSKSISKDKSLDLKAYIGCGLSRTKSEMYEMISTYYYEYTHFETSGINGFEKDSYHEDYKSIGTIYENKLNITSGLLFDFSSGVQMGIGFDTQPGGINLMLGFTIGKH